mgnify:FL=1
MIPIPQDVLLKGYNKPVHVQGWHPGAQFLYKGTDAEGTHHLVTPKTRRRVTTRNPLCYTKRNEPHP